MNANDVLTRALLDYYASLLDACDGERREAVASTVAACQQDALNRAGFTILTRRRASALPDAATVAAVRVAIAACDEQAARRVQLADDFATNPDGADAAEQAASEAQMARDAAATLRSWLAAQEGTGDGNG